MEIITENIDLWTSSVKEKKTVGRGRSSKRELYGIKKLRELILELAVHGLLVPQDPNDEPVAKLISRIENEKTKLITEGKIKKPKPLPDLIEGECASQLPLNWQWVHLQEICEYIQRGKGPKYAESGKVRVVSQKCIQWNGFDTELSRFIDDVSLDKYQSERFLKQNDLLWNSTGTGTVGRINRIHSIALNKFVADSHVTVIRTALLDSHFILTYLSSSGIQARVEPSHGDPLVSGSTKQVELNTSSILALPVPLPPLAEQKRIVAKVDELMALCDQLEQQTEDQITTHETLVKTLLDALTSATNDAAQFQQAWQQLEANFDLLFTTESSIDHLKQAILQLAVMGKLVEQDKVESAKDDFPEWVNSHSEQGNKPINWLQVKLGDLGEWRGGGTPAKTNSLFWNGRIPWVCPKDMKRDIISDSIDRITEEAIEKSSAKLIPKNSLLMVVRGMILAHSFPVALTSCEVAVNQDMKGVLLHYPSSAGYILLSLKALKSDFVSSVERSSHGTCKLVTRDLHKITIPIPPLAEQQRIVYKVNELTSLCDTLKVNLQAAKEIKIKLTDCIVQEAAN